MCIKSVMAIKYWLRTSLCLVGVEHNCKRDYSADSSKFPAYTCCQSNGAKQFRV